MHAGSLGVKYLSSAADSDGRDSGGTLRLKATSIFGDGDKIALPPSVLGTLSESMNDDSTFATQQQQQQPWTFRIGILNPDYVCPASPILQALPLSAAGEDDGAEEDHHGDGDDDDDKNSHTAAYLDELRHKYLAYTHGTVVEFTQDEGHVGLPEPIAVALIQQAAAPPRSDPMETTRTVDKAAAAGVNDDMGESSDRRNESDEKTPGHLAWGAFDIPTASIEITMVQLPKGRTATLRPTLTAVRSGFYNLKDVKMVLEQSLIRTRATLTVGDVIRTWHRGTKFDLTVTVVNPGTYQAVSCINTDIEVDFEPIATTPPSVDDGTATLPHATVDGARVIASLGRKLNDPSAGALPLTTVASLTARDGLVPEPPVEQRENVVTVQIRAPHGKGQRRFDVQTATVRDVFAFAASVLGVELFIPGGAANFQLVTRFPRRVFTLSDDGRGGASTLHDAGIAAGQELFIVETL